MTPRVQAARTELVEALAEAVRTEAASGPPNPPRSRSVQEAAELIGIGRTFAYREIKAGRLRATRRGRRVLISENAIRDYLEGAA